MTSPSLSQMDKARQFRALHEKNHTFIIPNPWDIGSAKMLTALGFQALASTSAGYAFSLGGIDNSVDRASMMQHLVELARATHLPVAADLGNGFGDAPRDAADAIELAAAAGMVGASIEDATGRQDEPQYPFELAVERVRAAVQAAHNLTFPFTVTARAENFLVGNPDLDDTIHRLQAYQSAGADVLYAPGLTTLSEIKRVIASLEKPVNVLVGRHDRELTVAALTALGVRRISLGSALARVAYGAMLRAGHELLETGTFGFLDEAVAFGEITKTLSS